MWMFQNFSLTEMLVDLLKDAVRKRVALVDPEQVIPDVRVARDSETLFAALAAANPDDAVSPPRAELEWPG